MKYTLRPKTNIDVLFSIDHFLSITSHIASAKAATIISTKNRIFVFMLVCCNKITTLHPTHNPNYQCRYVINILDQTHELVVVAKRGVRYKLV